MNLPRLLFPAVVALLGLTCGAAEPADLPKPPSRTVMKIHGWSVQVDDRLLADPDAVLGHSAIKLLEAKLSDIDYVVGGERLERLRLYWI